jgi:hypothetical protein
VMLGQAAQDGHGLVAAAVSTSAWAAAPEARAGQRGGSGSRPGPGSGRALAGQDLLLQVVDLGDDRQQGPGVGVAGGGQHGLGRALLDDGPGT